MVLFLRRFVDNYQDWYGGVVVVGVGVSISIRNNNNSTSNTNTNTQTHQHTYLVALSGSQTAGQLLLSGLTPEVRSNQPVSEQILRFGTCLLVVVVLVVLVVVV